MLPTVHLSTAMVRDLPDEDRDLPREFRDEDTEKLVVAPEGNILGSVKAIDQNRGRATVERTDEHDSLTDGIKDMLGWGDDDESDREIRHEHVEEYKDDAIHLRGNS
jgi:hypothetical protein